MLFEMESEEKAPASCFFLFSLDKAERLPFIENQCLQTDFGAVIWTNAPSGCTLDPGLPYLQLQILGRST